MKSTLLISLDEDLMAFVNAQGQSDPSAFIGKILADCKRDWEQNPQHTATMTNETGMMEEVIAAAPSAGQGGKSASRALESISDLDTPAAG